MTLEFIKGCDTLGMGEVAADVLVNIILYIYKQS